MQKGSFLFLLILCAVALLGLYHAASPLPGHIIFTRFFALSAYFLLCMSLVIGPLIILRPAVFGQLAEPRRAIGIACFVFVLLHILVLLALRYNWGIRQILNGDPLVSIPAALLLLALTLTSSDYAVKKLGPSLWKNVQRFNYLAFILVSVHFITKATGLPFISSGKSLNLAESALLILGLMTVGLQIAGFIARRKRMKAAAAPAAPAKSG